MKTWATDWEQIFTTHRYDRALLFRRHKNIPTRSYERGKGAIQTIGKRFEDSKEHLAWEDAQMTGHAWKSAQHPYHGGQSDALTAAGTPGIDRERDESKCRRGHRATGTLMHWCRERKGVWPLWNAVWDFLGNAADPVIPSFSSLAFTQEKWSHVHRKTRTRMYQKLKTTPCLSAGECTSKLWL